MREKFIKGAVLSVVFVAALFVFSHMTNQGDADMTADMGSATFPTISFVDGEQNLNLTAGHLEEMDFSAVRDTITPIKNGMVEGQIQAYDNDISSIEYTLYSLDGTEKIAEGVCEREEDSFCIPVTANDAAEAVLKIDLQVEDREIFYYNRVISGNELYVTECLNYAKELHENMLTGTNEHEIKKVMEENALGDNTSLQRVTIHSNLEHSMWGDLNPEVVGDVRISIQEIKKAYTSVLFQYRVKCAGDNNAEELYDVREFFRVSYSDGKLYLLDYDRTLNEVFQGENVVLMSKGINLGLTTADTQYKSNQDGTIVSFVQNRELWSYNEADNAFALVFSFAGAERDDVRNHFDKHSIRILSMEENGNITFAVYGYMNRGSHEGKSGVVIYYYKCSQNVVEEKAFIPSNKSKAMIEKELGKVAFYNDEANILYVLAGGSLYQMNLETEETTILLEELDQTPYVSSVDGHLLAFQNASNPAEAVVINFEEDSRMTVVSSAGEQTIPLGFIKGDFVYGISKNEDAGLTASGDMVQAMYKLEIRDSQNRVVKEYVSEGSYILGAEFESNLITLDRAVIKNGVYTGVSEDYIANNEEKVNAVTLKSYWTDLKETQFRLVYDKGMENRNAVVRKPKQVLFEKDTTLDVNKSFDALYYTVYGHGEMKGIFEEAGDAIQMAKTVSGVVISPEQRYVWEDGNRVAWYRNFELRAFVPKEGESTLDACVRQVLEYAGSEADIKSELESKTIMEVLAAYSGGEAVRMEDCSVADMRYLIDKAIPVIAMTGNDEGIVLIGYDAVSVTYIEPSSGAIRMKSFQVVDDMIKDQGNTFFAYVN